MEKPVRLRLAISGGDYLGVVIWPTHKQYLAGTAHHYDAGGHPNRVASYRKGYRHGCFGYCYFSADMIGAGTVAHELAHFMWDLLSRRYKTPVSAKRDEATARLIDRLTSSIWRAYFRRWPEKP